VLHFNKQHWGKSFPAQTDTRKRFSAFWNVTLSLKFINASACWNYNTGCDAQLQVTVLLLRHTRIHVRRSIMFILLVCSGRRNDLQYRLTSFIFRDFNSLDFEFEYCWHITLIAKCILISLSSSCSILNNAKTYVQTVTTTMKRMEYLLKPITQTTHKASYILRSTLPHSHFFIFLFWLVQLS